MDLFSAVSCFYFLLSLAPSLSQPFPLPQSSFLLTQPPASTRTSLLLGNVDLDKFFKGEITLSTKRKPHLTSSPKTSTRSSANMANPTLLDLPVEIQMDILNRAIITEVVVCLPEQESEDQGCTYGGPHNKCLENPNLNLLLINQHFFHCALLLIPQAVDLQFSTMLCAHYHLYNSPGLCYYVSKITATSFTRGVYAVQTMRAMKKGNQDEAWGLLQEYVPVNARAVSTWGPMLQTGNRRFHKYTTVVETGISKAPRVMVTGRARRNARKKLKLKMKKQAARFLRVALAKAWAIRRH